jgi:hypothetical protein
MCVAAWKLETKNSRFGDWQVTWLGGWTRDRLSYIVMVVPVSSYGSTFRRAGATAATFSF